MSASQKMTVIGISASAPGAISKAGKAYRVGSLHTMAPLAAPFAEGGIEKGSVGMSISCDPDVVRPLVGLPMPVVCEVETETVIRFGKPEQQVISVRPAQSVKVQA